MIASCCTKIKSILILSGLCWLVPIQLSYSQNTVVLDEAESLTHIGQNTTYLEDLSGTLRIADIVSGRFTDQFQKTDQVVPNFSSTGSAYWLKFDIQQQANETFYLEVGTAFMDSISLFQFNEAGDLQSARYSGDDLPFEHREVLIGNYLFELNIPQNTTHTFYLRIKSKQPLFFPLRVGTLKQFTEYNHNQDYIQGIYFGFMLMIFFYNLFLYFKSKGEVVFGLCHLRIEHNLVYGLGVWLFL
ncbi:MAG: 7TM-DISM domain-containing protein [Fulvivirga sp.]